MIELRHVSKSFGEISPLKDVNAQINDGDVISLIGPSGCGKSTLLRCINLLDPPSSGQIIINDVDITNPSYDPGQSEVRMGMVFQRFNLFGHWTVVENIMNPQINLLNRDRQEAYDKALELLKLVGLSDKTMAYPRELSGGQQQRVAIARTLAMDPRIILFDEPTSALDPANVGEVEQVIRSLASQDRTMIIVTHEMRFAQEISTRVFYMDEGIIFEEGSPEEIFDNPRHDKTRRFTQQLKTMTFTIDSQDFDFPALVSCLDDYCGRYRISYELNRRLQRVVEELCVSILLPRLGNKPAMQIFAEFNTVSHELSVLVYYNGDSFNPLDSDNDLALTLLDATTSNIEHSRVQKDEYTNRVQTTVKP